MLNHPTKIIHDHHPSYPPGKAGTAIRRLNPKRAKLLKHPLSDKPQPTPLQNQLRLPGFP